MAFFASKSFDRDHSTLRRTFSTDRIRRGGSSREPTPATEFGVLADTNQREDRHRKAARTAADAESFFPGSLPVASSSTLASASASASAPFSVPHIPTGSASGSPASSVRMQAQTYASDSKYSLRAPSPASGAGSSKHSSPSPNPPRRRGQQQREGVPRSRDGSDASHSSPSHSAAPSPAPGVSPSPSISSKRVDEVAMAASMARARSSPDLKVEQRSTPKSRSKMSLRTQIAENYYHNDSQGASGMLSTPVRQPRGPRSPNSASSTHLSTTAHANRNAARGMVFPSGSAGQSPASPSMSSSSSSPLSPQSSTRQRPATSSASMSTARREDPTLTIPKGYMSSGGSVSDGSYGSPFCELGMGFNVKRLLSKPAASSGTSAVRSEPDTDGSYSYGYGYGYNGYSHSLNSSAATRRRRMDTSPRPPSARSTSAAGADASPTVQRMMYPGTGGPRKPTTSDPEPPQRQRGFERGHEKEGERERKRSGRGHVRNHSSSFSLSSPSEGAGYPFGLALERERERVTGSASSGTQTHIQLTTSAVRRLSALGVREADSPVTPMSFSTSSPASASAEPNPVVGTRTQRSQQASRPQAPAGVSRRADSPPPPGLTPAEIVAHAYKQQERRRAELERDASKDVSEPDRSRIVQKEKAQRSARGKEKLTRSMSVEDVKAGSGTEAPAPYYTVFGNPSGRVVAIGSARDSAFGLFERGGGGAGAGKKTERAVVAEISMSSVTQGAAATADAPLTLRRKLSRKMSGKFRRDGSVPRVGKGSSEGREGGVGEWGDLYAAGDGASAEARANRPSLSLKTPSSERRSATLPRERTTAAHLLQRPSPKLSMDSFVAVQSTDSGSGRTLPSAVNGCIATPITFIPGTWGDRVVSDPSARPRVKSERHEKENHKDKGKLWGLVKRISSNALKDKYKPPSTESPPPVPALPRDFSPVLPTEFDFEKTRESEGSYAQEARDTCVAVPKVTTPPFTPATYERRPSTAPALTHENSAGRFTVRQKQPSAPVQLLGVKNQSQGHEQRPSTTTRSSSPISSDIASSNSFNRSQSNRSSTSSYGELTTNGKVVNIATATLGQHIVPPEKLFLFDSLDLSFGNLDDYGAKNRSDANGASKGFGGPPFGEESSGHQALPVPPRRANQARQEESIRSRSPSIPTFSADNAVNTFGFRGRSATIANSVTSAFTGTDFGGQESASSNSSSPPSALDPPPRPPRSVRRGPIPTHSTSPSIPSVSRTVSSERAGRESIGAHSQASTARPSVTRYSASPSPPSSPPPLLSSQQSPVSATDSQTSTLTFHDAARPKATWTEKEKLDKWNDLLDRSEKAGGTLHVGLGGLLSDHMRESAYGGVRDSAYSEF